MALSVFVIIPVHNRKTITLNCIECLVQIRSSIVLKIVVVDDGSTDGTAEAIVAQYPEIYLIRGDGTLWWAGSIEWGMRFAYEQGASFFIWLNDDCLPQSQSIEWLLKICCDKPFRIAGAQSCDPDSQQPSYGGFIKRWNRVKPINAQGGNTVECDCLSGNLVCLPRNVVEAIGYPNFRRFPQYYCDAVYTHQAKRHGFEVLLVGKAIAYCKDDHLRESWLRTERSWQQVWSDRYNIKSHHYWRAHLAYNIYMLGGIGIFIYIYSMHIRFFGIFLLKSFFAKFNSLKKLMNKN